MGRLLLSPSARPARRVRIAAEIAVGDDGGVTLRGRGTRVAALGRVPDERRALLDAFVADDGVADAELDVLLAAPQDRYFVGVLARRGFLTVDLVDGDDVVATIAVPDLPDEPTLVPARVALSPHVLIRTDDGVLVLESSIDASRRDEISGAFAGALLTLAAPKPAATSGLPAAWAEPLVRSGILVDADREPVPAVDPVTRWDFHDQLLHSRSRLWCGAARPYGATYRLRGGMDPLPARSLPAWAPGPAIDLPIPDLASRTHTDPGLTAVMEARRSRRDFGPLDVDQLGELLFRVARARGVRPHASGDEIDKPVPAGGALHELELYPLVVACRGIDPGLYHYEPFDHELHRVDGCADEIASALAGVARDTAMLAADAPLGVCLLIAARFGRLQFKYSSMAYAAVLKNVGVLYEALYLVAEAMGLAACALGGGDTGLFARATGADPWDEGSVGEFLVGARAEEGEQEGRHG
ncbi:MAG TPA: SagB family peptide dehydrogenase [Acidimicrobiia bacterium]